VNGDIPNSEVVSGAGGYPVGIVVGQNGGSTKSSLNKGDSPQMAVRQE
jgi:hypothetical protein